MRISTLKFISLFMATINSAVWAVLTILGVQGLKGIWEQHAKGFPNIAQLAFYFVLPLAMTLFAVVYPLLRLRTGKENLGIALSVIMILSVLVYLFLYGGGV